MVVKLTGLTDCYRSFEVITMFFAPPMIAVISVPLRDATRGLARTAQIARDGSTVYVTLAHQREAVVVLRAAKGERFVGSGKMAPVRLSPDRRWLFAQFTRDAGTRRLTVLDFLESGGLGYMGGPESFFNVWGGRKLGWLHGEPETLLITDAAGKSHRVDLRRAWRHI